MLNSASDDTVGIPPAVALLESGAIDEKITDTTGPIDVAPY